MNTITPRQLSERLQQGEKLHLLEVRTGRFLAARGRAGEAHGAESVPGREFADEFDIGVIRLRVGRLESFALLEHRVERRCDFIWPVLDAEQLRDESVTAPPSLETSLRVIRSA